MCRNTGKRYSHNKRTNSPYWYAEIKNPKTGKYMSPRSTREKDESAALLVIADWIKNGLPDPY